MQGATHSLHTFSASSHIHSGRHTHIHTKCLSVTGGLECIRQETQIIAPDIELTAPLETDIHINIFFRSTCRTSDFLLQEAVRGHYLVQVGSDQRLTGQCCLMTLLPQSLQICSELFQHQSVCSLHCLYIHKRIIVIQDQVSVNFTQVETYFEAAERERNDVLRLTSKFSQMMQNSL